jgi:hypothetical protein
VAEAVTVPAITPVTMPVFEAVDVLVTIVVELPVTTTVATSVGVLDVTAGQTGALTDVSVPFF